MDSNVETRLLTREDLPYTTKLFNEVFGLDSTVEHAAWKFFGSPARNEISAPSIVAVNSGRIIGMYPSTPYRMSFKRRPIRAVQVVDNCVHPDYRHIGVQKAMHSHWMSLLRGNADFSFGFPNPTALALGTRRLQYVQILTTELFSCRSVSADSNTGGLSCERLDRFDSSTDMVWEDAVDSELMSVVRTKEYLNWRYIEVPSQTFRCVKITQASETVGFSALRYEADPCGMRAYIFELIRTRSTSFSKIFSALSAFLRDEGVTEIFTWENSYKADDLRKIGFEHRPSHARPLVYIPFSPPWTDSDTLVDPEKWYISLGDSDF